MRLQKKIRCYKNSEWTRIFRSSLQFKLVTDIAYIHVKPDAELVTNAVKNACLNIKNTRGMILHSDLGSQYTSDIFENYLSSKGIKHSFSRKENPYDNACIEPFHSLLKKEMIYCKEYHSFEEAQFDIFEYIESWYNRKRRHAFLNYKTPQEVEDYALNLWNLV